MLEQGIDYLFNEVSLYTKEVFNVFELKNDKYEYNKDEFFRFLYYIGIKQEKLITYCHKCKREFPFLVKLQLFEFSQNSRSNERYMDISKKSGEFGCSSISMTDGVIYGLQPPYEKIVLLDNKIWYIEYYFTCTNKEKHKYIMMISIELKDGKFIVRKIGQNPSMLTVKGFDFDKYKKFLDRINAYDDYKKADLCNSDHFYVGAYAYLRRIFEKMIKFYLGDNELKDNHMDTKIDAVKNNFDPRVNKMLKNLYGILSISIHELDEEQSKEYYTYLKAVIDMQLEYVKSEDEKNKQSKDLEGILNKIANLVKK